MGREHLVATGSAEPEIEAEVLLRHALRLDRAGLFTRWEHPISAEAWRQYRELLESRASGRPVHYILGQREFMGLTFAVDERVMIPRPETEVLVEYVVDTFREHASDGNHDRRSTIDDRQLVLVDVGTGSGCIAVSAAFYLPQAIVYATDISGAALTVARINAERHGTADRIIFLEGDLLFVLPENLRGQVDAVVSNPPYVPKSQRPSLPREVRDFEPAVAIIAPEKGTEIHQRLIAESPRWLRPPASGGGRRPAGLVVLEAGAGQAEAVAAALAEDGRYERARRLRDLAGAERVVVAALRYSPTALSVDGIGGSGSQRANY